MDDGQFSAMEAAYMEQIAREAATHAVASIRSEIVLQMRQELEAGREQIKKDVQASLAAVFGSMTPEKHAVSHARTDRFLNAFDKLQETFWGALVAKVASGILILMLAGVAWYAGRHS